MKLALVCVAAVLLSSVSGHEWFARRDLESGSLAVCKDVFAPVVRILDRGAFRYLIEDGHFSLDCSQETMSRGKACLQSDDFLCHSLHSPEIMFTALGAFCRHRTEIEDDASCWTSDHLLPAIRSCSGLSSIAQFVNCMEGAVTTITECSSGRTGAILRQLVLDMQSG